MAHDMNNPSAVDTQAPSKLRGRYILAANDVIKGLVQPGNTDPAGIMLMGPFAQKIWTIKYSEVAEVAANIRMVATYNLDIVRLLVSSSTPLSPYLQYTDAAPTWETVATTAVAKLGTTAFTVNWSTLGLSKNTVPTAVRFYFLGSVGQEVRIEIEDGIL